MWSYNQHNTPILWHFSFAHWPTQAELNTDRLMSLMSRQKQWAFKTGKKKCIQASSVVEDSCRGKNWQKPRQRKHCCNWRQELFPRQKGGSVTSSQNFQYFAQTPSYYFQFLVTTDSCLTNPCVLRLGAYLSISLWRGYSGNIEYKQILLFFKLPFLTQIFFFTVWSFLGGSKMRTILRDPDYDTFMPWILQKITATVAK